MVVAAPKTAGPELEAAAGAGAAQRQRQRQRQKSYARARTRHRRVVAHEVGFRSLCPKEEVRLRLNCRHGRPMDDGD